MNYSKDYENIRMIIDEIIGIDTQVGGNLKKAVKKYFELKPINVKLASPEVKVKYVTQNTESKMIKEMKKEAEESLDRYSKKLKEGIKKIKDKGEYRGISS